MEFFLGAFERDWERRRAALLHELRREKCDEIDWERPRRGGMISLPKEDSGVRRGSEHTTARSIGRPMRVRFAALARGSQPAVVKLASYGGGLRAAAMISYISRSGELPVENERGEQAVGKAVLELSTKWEHLFDNRTASRDVGFFQVTIADAPGPISHEQQSFISEILTAGFGDRRLVYAAEQKNANDVEIRGVVVLRDKGGERLTGDGKAAAIVQRRFEESGRGSAAGVKFSFRGHGNGVEVATARVRELVDLAKGDVKDELGRDVPTFEEAGRLVQNEWRHELHSRRGRDVMHLIVSARAGTDVDAFRGAVGDFLGEQFIGHRYVFALHDPAHDPKQTEQGGRRPHVHLHAIVTMRSETGERIETTPGVFRQWRALMAEKAREHGIDMELTDRRDFASSPAYSRNQVRPVSYAGRTEHKGTSQAAQRRYEFKRAERHHMSRSARSVGYALEVARTWSELSIGSQVATCAAFAAQQTSRLFSASNRSQLSLEKSDLFEKRIKFDGNVVDLRELIEGEGTLMRAMTRPEFEKYERRVQQVLSTVEASVKPSERRDYDEIAAAARAVVDIRREYLDLFERQSAARSERADGREGARYEADGEHGSDANERGNAGMPDFESPKQTREQAAVDRPNRSRDGASVDQKRERFAHFSAGEIAETDRDFRKESDAEPVGLSSQMTSSTGSSAEPKLVPVGSRDEEVSQPVDHVSGEDRDVAGEEGSRARERTRSEYTPTTDRLRVEGTDPAPQQVSRLQELEREDGQGHKRDDRER